MKLYHAVVEPGAARAAASAAATAFPFLSISPNLESLLSISPNLEFGLMC